MKKTIKGQTNWKQSDIILKGYNWNKAIDSFSDFFDNEMQPNYSIFKICVSIGIMYDKTSECAGSLDIPEGESWKTVPRTVLNQHQSDLDYLFQTAIISSTIDAIKQFNQRDRMKLAFDEKCDINFDRYNFLLKFGNFGVSKLLELLDQEPILTMNKIKNFIDSSSSGYNIDTIADIKDDDIDE